MSQIVEKVFLPTYTGQSVDQLIALEKKAITDLLKLDDQYFQNEESIEDSLFAYIKTKKKETVL